MRIPWKKVHRAFPELDRFEDRQCLEFIQLACRKFWRSRMIVGILGLTVCAATFIALMIGLNTVLDGVMYRTVAERRDLLATTGSGQAELRRAARWSVSAAF